jgi:pimeloyl-ACP methyl ester carboxylesterase
MPYLQRDRAQIFYDQIGEGDAIITTHGVSENGSYWSLPGVSGGLAARYRVIDMDMRGHGRSVVHGEPKGYDVETIAEDIGALADHLGLERFHLLTHATGGMAGLRYAMRHSDRLLSLMSTDTGSATIPSDQFCSPEYDDQDFQKIDPSGNPMALPFEHTSVRELLRGARQGNAPGPFLNRLSSNPDPHRVWKMVEDVIAAGNPLRYAEFMRRFYDDPDPKVKLLREIRCPCLVLLGEHDVMFVKPSELLARCIPDVKHVVLEGLGHMTAIEDPERTLAELLRFLEEIESR